MKKNKDIKQRQGQGNTTSKKQTKKQPTQPDNKNIQSQKQIKMLSFILGNSSSQKIQQNQSGQITKQLIIKSAMFWDSKKRIQKIKSLFLKNCNLQQFDSNQEFKVDQLVQIQLLNLQKNKIIHLHPISSLETLVSLNINRNKVYDLNPISRLLILSQLYASFNQINDTSPLKGCKQLKIINLYSNKIEKQEQTFMVMSSFQRLEELDIEQNAVFSQNFNQGLMSLNLKKINGQIITNKNKNINNSQMFTSTISKGLATSTIFNNRNQSMLATKTTFYNFNKNNDQIGRKQQILKKLQLHYAEIDQQFQRQIQKNVKIKSQYQNLSQKLKQSQYQHEDQIFKKQEIKILKRKVKAMKQNLFSKTKKGQILRKLFQLQTIYKSSKDQKTSKNKESLSFEKQIQQISSRNNIFWHRKFEADQVIVISSQRQINNKYLDEEEEINDMLESIDQSIGNIKNDLQYLV